MPADVGGTPGKRPLELWVGAECTINRVGDRWRDQAIKTGFRDRPLDLDRLASLGAKRIRLPVLWERTATDDGGFDWRWPDAALARLRALDVPAIVGLLHHGSGPRVTHLADERFPARFAAYARAVARRYPEQRFWTPINEPVTTARFSGLYGHWYPHLRSDHGFVRTLLQQIHGTVAAMREIRKVTPSAQLIQTDDVGHTRSTPGLAAQAGFDNDRRWLGFDLLCGRVDAHHPLWRYLLESGATASELDALRDTPCVPDIIGINAYITSERFLDERLSLYPPHLHGGNGVERYVDIETARAHGEPIHGFAGRIAEAWTRYRLPLAITEVHLGCTREEQLRWFHQAWAAAATARADGVDIRAVTAWAAFGTMDWDSLLTRDDEHYEPGLWDVRSDPPRITALGSLAQELGTGVEPTHPVANGAGWWERELRLAVPGFGELEARPAAGPPLLILGAAGRLGRGLARLCRMRGLPFVALTHADLDIVDVGAVYTALEHHRPWAVVNAAGFSSVDDAESDPRQWRDNAAGPIALARVCAAHGTRLLTFSSALVFSGPQREPFLEQYAVAPLNAYGRAKAHADAILQADAPGTLVVRTGALFGPWESSNFATSGLARAARGQPWRAASDQVITPSYLPDLVQASLDLLIDGEAGLWHLSNGEALSWADFAERIVAGARLPSHAVVPTLTESLRQRARRPDYCALGSGRGQVMPTLDDALARFRVDREHPMPADEPARAASNAAGAVPLATPF